MKVRRFAKVLLAAGKWIFVLLCLYLISLFFHSQRLSGRFAEAVIGHFVPTNIVIHVGSASFGFSDGIKASEVRVFDRLRRDSAAILAAADEVNFNPFSRTLTVVGAKYPRLPDSYYEPGNLEKNERVEAELPDVPEIRFVLERPIILGVAPERVTGYVRSTTNRLSVTGIHLDWPDADRHLDLNGFCTVDLAEQRIRGEAKGLALQRHLRDMMLTLDVPVAMPYYDGFTEVVEPVPSTCIWDVNLVNNDLDLTLFLHPQLGRYNGVSMKRADGVIRLRNRIRGTYLNYNQTIGPIDAVDHDGRQLHGTVSILGTNGYNTVRIEAKSTLPVVKILKIGGFEGDYVGKDVLGESEGSLEFRFPRAMTNNYEVLNGSGRISVKNGQLMRMKGFAGLVELLAERVPGVSLLTDSTQAFCDYTIENGVLKSDNLYIEGSVFSIKMVGSFDAVKNRLDYVVRVQFAQKDSWLGKVLHPLAWPFTKLLLEFRLKGTPENPKWEYVSVIDRVLEVVK